MAEQNETRTAAEKARERHQTLKELRVRRDKLTADLGSAIIDADELADVEQILSGIKDEITAISFQIERLESRPHPGITESEEDRSHFAFRSTYKSGVVIVGCGAYHENGWLLELGTTDQPKPIADCDVGLSGPREATRRTAYKLANAMASALAAAAREIT